MSYLLEKFIDNYAGVLEEKRKAQERLNSEPESSRLVRLIQKRLKRNQDCKIAITGEGGVGKSTLALRLGEILNPAIYIDNIEIAINQATSFTAKEYMTGVRTLPTETQLTFDEPGQAWYHRQFMSEASMILSKTMIGFRFKRFISVLNIPNIDLLDVDGLRLLNFMVYITSQGKGEVFRVVPQKFGGNPWFKKVIDRFTFTKPDTKLWHAYEKRKFAIQDALYDQYGKQLDDIEKPKLTNREIVASIREEPEKFKREGKWHPLTFQTTFGVGLNRSYLIKAILDEGADEESEGAR